MKRSTARVALPQSKLAGTVTDGAGCAVEGDAAPDSAKAAERSKSPGRSADLLVMDDDPWIVGKVLLPDRERIAARSDRRRVGKEGVSGCRTRGWPYV